MSTWMKRRGQISYVSDVQSYCKSWVMWWTSCQPAWRQEKGWLLPRECPSSTNWVKLGARGQNGLFVVIMSTTWWATSIKSEEDWVWFDTAVDDVKWVIDRVIEALPACTPPGIPDTPNTSEPDAPPNWMVRGAGKRKPKVAPWVLQEGIK